MSEAVQTVLEFVERINARDVEGICALVTDDHTFVDSVGSAVSGRARVRAAWEGYFRMFPDYRVIVREVFADGDRVVLVGRAGAARWEIPAAWKAVVLGGQVWEWRVFADSGPAREALAPSPPPPPQLPACAAQDPSADQP